MSAKPPKTDAIKQNREALFLRAKDHLFDLQAFDKSAHEQIAPQIDYLLAVNAGVEGGNRLDQITIGVIAAKWLDPCPNEFQFLFDVANEARKMAAEFSMPPFPSGKDWGWGVGGEG